MLLVFILKAIYSSLQLTAWCSLQTQLYRFDCIFNRRGGFQSIILSIKNKKIKHFLSHLSISMISIKDSRVIFAVALLVRLIVFNIPSLSNTLIQRVELVTPITSFKRCKLSLKMNRKKKRELISYFFFHSDRRCLSI